MHPQEKATARVEHTGNQYHFSAGLSAYFSAVVLAAAGCLLFLAIARPFFQPYVIGLPGVFTGLVALAGVYPIHFASNTKISMGDRKSVV
jgi:hypothetical protein